MILREDNTNLKHLELYSIMAEHDNAGFPLSYCLLSTATAIDDGKRTRSLTAWANCLKEAYGVEPTFVHVDEDMAKITMARRVWNAKISLCWWHLRRAVRARLANGKLSTTPCNAKRARAEFTFIDLDFMPKGRPDTKEYEGGRHEDVNEDQPASASETIPKPSTSHSIAQSSTLPSSAPTPCPIPITMPRITIPARPPAPPPVPKRIDLSTMIRPKKAGEARKLTIWLIAPRKPETQTATENVSDADDEPEAGRQTFCPRIYRERIIEMMENHYCAHPLIPGYGLPTSDGIKTWAVCQMYNFCVNNKLPEVWAYLWENWYRKDRWELWARSAHSSIPILKTTMILESQ
jgi:hypothetical protein